MEQNNLPAKVQTIEDIPRPNLFFKPEHVISNAIGHSVPLYLKCKSLSAYERSFIHAKVQKPISAWDFKEVMAYNVILVGALLKQLRMFKTENQESLIENLSFDFTKEMKKHFGHNTLHEAMLACEMGIRDKFANLEFKGDFSCITFHKWMTAFNELEARKAASKLYNDFVDDYEKNKPLDDYEKHEIMTNGLLSCFDHFQKTGIITTEGYTYFNKLVEYGVLWLKNQEEMEAIYKQAQEEMIAKAKAERETSLVNIVNFQRILEALQGGKHIQVSNLAKRKALAIFFNQVITKKANLKTIYETAFINHRKGKQEGKSRSEEKGKGADK